MKSLNQVTLIGNLGKKPEIRAINSGKEVCSFSVATSKSFKDKATNEWRDVTEWHKVVTWNEYIIKACSMLDKGAKVYVQGELATRKWQDKSGQDKYTTEINCQNFMSFDKKEPSMHKQEKANGYQPEAIDDEIPF